MFNFGKHKDKTLRQVLNESPSYVNWCVCTIPRFRLMLKRDYPQLYAKLRRARVALALAEDAWAWSGGRKPGFDWAWHVIENPNANRRKGVIWDNEEDDDEAEVQAGNQGLHLRQV